MPTASTAGKSRVKSGEFTAEDHILKTVIFAWRWTHAIEEYAVQEYGACLLISDRLIDRLVLCAWSSKLHTVASIFKETGWRRDWAATHAPSLLALICSHTPTPQSVRPSTVTTDPLTASSSATESTPASDTITTPQPTKKACAKQQCSWCKGLGLNSSGHNSMCFILYFVSQPFEIWHWQNPINHALASQSSPSKTIQRMCSLQILWPWQP